MPRKPTEKQLKYWESKKGKPAWNKGLLGYGKGHTVSTEARIKIGNATRGKTPWCKGKKLSKTICEKISEKRTGMKFTEEHIKNLSFAHTGIKTSKKGMKSTYFGEKHWNWRGGTSSLQDKLRHTHEMNLWRKAVFTRDNYTCQKTGKIGGKLVAHHIKNFSSFPELRTSIENGITLSEESHIEFHKIYGKNNNTREQIESFLEQKIYVH